MATFSAESEGKDTLFIFDAEAWIREPEPAFDSFLKSRRPSGRPLRASSFAIYRGMFKRLLAWLEGYGLTVHDLDALLLEGFLASRDLSEESRHRYLLAFTELYQHLAAVREAEQNPARELLTAAPAPDRLHPEALGPDEVAQALTVLRAQATARWKDRRLEAMFCLLLGAGLRTTELLELRPKDIERGDSVWVAPRKPRREREVPLYGLAKVAAADWLALRRGELARIPGERLFPANDVGDPLPASTLFRQVQGILEAAGISRRYEGPTLLRNTCAAAWLASQPVHKVQGWLGHELERTTEQLLPAAAVWQGSTVLEQPLYPQGRPALPTKRARAKPQDGSSEEVAAAPADDQVV